MDAGVSSIFSHQTTLPELSFFCRLSYYLMLMFLLKVYLPLTFCLLFAKLFYLSAPMLASDRSIFKHSSHPAQCLLFLSFPHFGSTTYDVLARTLPCCCSALCITNSQHNTFGRIGIFSTCRSQHWMSFTHCLVVGTYSISTAPIIVLILCDMHLIDTALM